MEKVRAERIATRSAQSQKRGHGGSFGMSSSKRRKGPYQGNWAGSTTSSRQRFGPGKSKSLQVSSTRTGNMQKSQGPASCEHCGNYHFGKCRTITGACYKCGATDHYIRDCPKVGNRPEISERSVGQSQKGKYSVINNLSRSLDREHPKLPPTGNSRLRQKFIISGLLKKRMHPTLSQRNYQDCLRSGK
ncbi:hypothetical protein V6N13_133753 [Hibiscus sabdariffa]